MTLPSSAPQLGSGSQPHSALLRRPQWAQLTWVSDLMAQLLQLAQLWDRKDQGGKKTNKTKTQRMKCLGSGVHVGHPKRLPPLPRIPESLATQGVMVSAVGLGPQALTGIGDVAVGHPEIKGHLLQEVGAHQGQAPHYLTCPHTMLWGKRYCLPPSPLQAHWFLSPNAHPLYSAVPSWRAWPPP